MSEYQYYEFVAIDRPLTAKQMAELRAISTRAEISSTRFRNEYQWGDLKAESAQLLERYFDAHLYFSNWGQHQLMLRLPRTRLDTKALKPFFVGRDSAQMKLVGEHVLLFLERRLEDTDEYVDEGSHPGSLAALSPLRAELVGGDLRCAYLAWLLAVLAEDVAEGAVEPPVPPGLAALTAPQLAMVEFLRLDQDLLAAAAQASPEPVSHDDDFRRWVTRLLPSQKEAWLLRGAENPALPLGTEMLRTFRAEQGSGAPEARRTVRELRALAAVQRTARKEAEAARARKARAAAEQKRQHRLDQLGRDVPGAWTKLEALVARSDYDDAVPLAVDLRDLAQREGDSRGFAERFAALHHRHARRRGFFDRWKRQLSQSG